MSFLTNWIDGWLKNLLIDGIMGSLGGLFDNVNAQVGVIAGMTGQTPGDFNPGVFALIRNLSETVVLPIAGLLLTFVMTWELIQLIIDYNNLHQLDKWIFKTMIAVLLLSNTFNIVMGIFDVSQHVISRAGGVISNDTAVTLDMLETFRAYLQTQNVGILFVILMESLIVHVIVLALYIVIFVIVFGRMIEIYLLVSLAPLPMATLTNREMSNMGHNYLKSLLAVGFQGFLMMVCVGIYAVMVQNIATGGNALAAVWVAIGYTVLLCFTLFKTGSISKSIFSAH